MALGTLPPWINVGPTDYLQAIQSGTQAGLEVSRQRAAMQEAAARRIAAQQEAQRSAWEFGERLRQQAQLAEMENERQAQYQSGMLDWRREQMRMDAEKAAMGDQEAQARLEETKRHNLATEGISMDRAEALARRGEAQIVTHPEAPDYLFLRNPSGSEAVITRPRNTVSSDTALEMITNPYKYSLVQSAIGPEATNLVNIARSGIIPRSAAPPQEGTLSTNAPENGLFKQATEPTISTKSEYDALPNGTVYIGKDGKRYRKP